LLGRRMARFNRQVLNHLTRPLARHLPGFGIIIHRGRRSGRVYETPVNVFRLSNGYVVALTYGAGADWVRNVIAAGVCDLITHGRRVPVVVSHIQHDEQLLPVPAIVRPILRLLHVADFLHLSSPQAEHDASLP
jgi:deazaflavin-dependent oxidoreductase (nitroreductase family)